MERMFSGHKGIKLEPRNRNIAGKPPNTWEPNSTHLSNPWTKEEVSGEI